MLTPASDPSSNTAAHRSPGRTFVVRLIAGIAVLAFAMDVFQCFFHAQWSAWGLTPDGRNTVRRIVGRGGCVWYAWARCNPYDTGLILAPGTHDVSCEFNFFLAIQDRVNKMLRFDGPKWSRQFPKSISAGAAGFYFGVKLDQVARAGAAPGSSELTGWAIRLPLYPFWVIPLLIAWRRWAKHRKRVIASGFTVPLKSQP